MPSQTLFVYIANFIHKSSITIGIVFLATYLSASSVQLLCLLYFAYILIHTLWHYKIDPDSSAIPYLTALGDFFGSLFLLFGFMFLRAINYEYD